jgi:glutamate dehydrogenase (NADP+)
MATQSSVSQKDEVEDFMAGLVLRNPGEPEFHQAVHEVVESVMPFLLEHERYRTVNILERITEPDRIISFRVCWQDDHGKVQVNRAWRVQFNNSIGPYKGGMRFHPTVNQGILKFLGFEQCLKNALTTLPMGGGKGGSNFDPKGKSDAEVMRFCQSLMTELFRHIGEDTDVPAGDIGVGAREISYLFGQYKRIENRFVGTMTGKGLSFGGSLIRKEATGYGLVYFVREVLSDQKDSLEDKTVVISGSGNVSIYAAEKALELGAKVVSFSDSGGRIHDPEGVTEEKLSFLKDLKEVRRGRISDYAERFNCDYQAGQRPWDIPCDLALPCATQNELDVDDARALVAGGCKIVAEGANMPCTADAARIFREAGVHFGPGKAANAGGVAVSGLEQSQNAQRYSWSAAEVDKRLRDIMAKIHAQCTLYGEDDTGRVDYVRGANLAGFVKVADAMLAYGVV